MNDSTDAVHLNNHHRDTLMAIFQHPTSHNIEWRAVVSLLNVTGDAQEMPDGKYRVTLGGEEIIMNKPRQRHRRANRRRSSSPTYQSRLRRRCRARH